MDHLPSSSPFQQSVNNFFIKADKAADHTPVVSFASNSVNIFQKMVVLPLLNKFSPATITNSHYLTHIKEKKISDCVFLMIPGAATFTYLGKKAFASANKQLDAELAPVKTTDNLTGAENQESKNVAKNQEAEKPETAEGVSIHDQISTFTGETNKLTKKLKNDYVKNSLTITWVETKMPSFGKEAALSSENLKMEDFVEKFNSIAHPKLEKLKDILKDDVEIASYKKSFNAYDKNLPLPNLGTLQEQLRKHENLYRAAAKVYDKQVQQGEKELEQFEILLEKKEYPCNVPNILSDPSSRSTMKIESESDLIKLRDAYSSYVTDLHKTRNNFNDKANTMGLLATTLE